MFARDLYHDTVVEALKADGWTITHDPYHVAYGNRNLYIDLGAERATIAAEKNDRKIVVEIKSFLSVSAVNDFEDAVGQYSIYRTVLEEVQPDRAIFLAVPTRAYEEIFTEKFGQFVVSKLQIRLVVFDEQQKRIVRWID